MEKSPIPLRRRLAGLAVLGVLLAASAYFLITGVSELRAARELRADLARFVSVPCDRVEASTPSLASGNGPANAARVECTYRVAGQTYHADNLLSGGTTRYANINNARRAAELERAHTDHALYDPANPSRAVLSAEIGNGNATANIAIGAAVPGILIFGFALVGIRKLRRTA